MPLLLLVPNLALMVPMLVLMVLMSPMALMIAKTGEVRALMRHDV